MYIPHYCRECCWDCQIFFSRKGIYREAIYVWFMLLNIRRISYLLKLLKFHVYNCIVSGQKDDKMHTFVIFLCNMIYEMYIKIKIWKYEVILSKNTKGNKSELNHLYVFNEHGYCINATLKKWLKVLICIFDLCNKLWV